MRESRLKFQFKKFYTIDCTSFLIFVSGVNKIHKYGRHLQFLKIVHWVGFSISFWLKIAFYIFNLRDVIWLNKENRKKQRISVFFNWKNSGAKEEEKQLIGETIKTFDRQSQASEKYYIIMNPLKTIQGTLIYFFLTRIRFKHMPSVFF